MPCVLLPHRRLILVDGEDAAPFLDGLITSALPKAGDSVGSALLTPQGKLLFSFVVSRTDTGFRLECDARDADGLLSRLKLYTLRAKVELSLSETPVWAWMGADRPTDAVLDRRQDGLGARIYTQRPSGDQVPLESYQAHRVALGILEGPDEMLASQDFPHDLALDLTGMVSFDKGCFVGQEVVSRVKHRGTARRRPVQLVSNDLAAGQQVVSGDRNIGTVRLAAADRALAVIRLDQAKPPVAVEGQPVELALPPYATYSLQQADAS